MHQRNTNGKRLGVAIILGFAFVLFVLSILLPPVNSRYGLSRTPEELGEDGEFVDRLDLSPMMPVIDGIRPLYILGSWNWVWETSDDERTITLHTVPGSGPAKSHPARVHYRIFWPLYAGQVIFFLAVIVALLLRLIRYKTDGCAEAKSLESDFI
jgi:hypothetical protein